MPSAARLVRGLLACWLIASCLTAQETDPRQDPGEALEQVFKAPLLEDVRSRLSSDRPRTLAWGGYLAGEHGLSELEPDLRDALTRLAGTNRSLQARCARIALVDACCRLDLDLPDELIASLEGDEALRPALLLLVARRPADRGAILLRWMRTELAARNKQGVYYASGHILSLSPTPAFVAFLLEHLRCEVDLDVVDGDAPSLRSMTGFGGGALGFRPPKIPRAMPPIAVWTFARKPSPGNVLVATPGRGDGDMVFLQREICGEQLIEPRTRAFSGDNREVLIWLERAAATPGSWSRVRSRLDHYEYHALDLRETGFDASVRRLLERWQDGYALLLDKLEERGLLDTEAPPLSEVFTVSLRDERTPRVGPAVPLRWPEDAPMPATWERPEPLRARDG